MTARSRRVALVTCRVLPEPDPDQGPLLTALRDAGVEAELLPWDHPDADPASFDLCVLRSCWNYPHAPDAFLAWCERAAAASRLENALPAIRWNLHKRYLAELEEAGVPIVPTAWIAGGSEPDLRALLAERGWDDFVIKPAVSAASLHTRRFSVDDEIGEIEEIEEGLEAAEAFLAELAAERDVLVQRFAPGVETVGERALVWIDGELTHAIRKSPRFSGEDEEVSDAVPISDAERALAEAAMRHVRERVAPELLYARIDVVEDHHEGRAEPRLCELELMEPSLFLVQHPPALDRLVGAIVRYADS